MTDTFHLTVSVDSAAPLRVYPAWDYDENRDIRRADHRTQGGASTVAVLNTQAQFTVPLPWVSSADTLTVRTAWANGREVVWTVNASESSRRSWNCVITNQDDPLPEREVVNYNFHRGILFLRESGGAGEMDGGPFILDDATWGLLDQAYNVLT